MIENLGNIGDFIGGVGVFVTLLYLVTQVRQNTNSQRLASIQQIISTSVSISLTGGAGPLPGIFVKLEGGERLSEEEFAQFLMHIWALVTNHWQVFHQHKNGFIDQDVLEAYEARLQVTLKSPVARAMWRGRIRDGFPADFQDHIQGHFDRNPI
jgi:hypothetical protein